jgi:hypothetical protein
MYKFSPHVAKLSPVPQRPAALAESEPPRPKFSVPWWVLGLLLGGAYLIMREPKRANPSRKRRRKNPPPLTPSSWVIGGKKHYEPIGEKRKKEREKLWREMWKSAPRNADLIVPSRDVGWMVKALRQVEKGPSKREAARASEYIKVLY